MNTDAPDQLAKAPRLIRDHDVYLVPIAHSHRATATWRRATARPPRAALRRPHGDRGRRHRLRGAAQPQTKRGIRLVPEIAVSQLRGAVHRSCHGSRGLGITVTAHSIEQARSPPAGDILFIEGGGGTLAEASLMVSLSFRAGRFRPLQAPFGGLLTFRLVRHQRCLAQSNRGSCGHDL